MSVLLADDLAPSSAAWRAVARPAVAVLTVDGELGGGGARGPRPRLQAAGDRRMLSDDDGPSV
jgi:hypothetical protein